MTLFHANGKIYDSDDFTVLWKEERIDARDSTLIEVFWCRSRSGKLVELSIREQDIFQEEEGFLSEDRTQMINGYKNEDDVKNELLAEGQHEIVLALFPEVKD